MGIQDTLGWLWKNVGEPAARAAFGGGGSGGPQTMPPYYPQPRGPVGYPLPPANPTMKNPTMPANWTPAMGGMVSGNGVYTPPIASQEDEGWISGQQWYDPGEWFGENGQMMEPCPNRPVIVKPMVAQRLKAPPGYVIVMCGGHKVAMDKDVARAKGYWKPRSKPPITASEYKTVRKAERVKGKISRMVKSADKAVSKPIIPKRTTTTAKRNSRR